MVNLVHQKLITMISEFLEDKPNAVPIIVSVACIILITAVVRFIRYRLAFHKLVSNVWYLNLDKIS